MSKLRIKAGPFVFEARFETQLAPRTCEIFKRLLPYEQRVIHVRWSGEAVWIPLGEADMGVPNENQTSFPAPGQMLLYPGGLSETEILLGYGGVRFASKWASSPATTSSPSPRRWMTSPSSASSVSGKAPSPSGSRQPDAFRKRPSPSPLSPWPAARQPPSLCPAPSTSRWDRPSPAGPGIPSYYCEDPPQPCARSTNNYAHQIAARRGLALIDVSCSGAATAHLTGPPQRQHPAPARRAHAGHAARHHHHRRQRPQLYRPSHQRLLRRASWLKPAWLRPATRSPLRRPSRSMRRLPIAWTSSRKKSAAALRRRSSSSSTISPSCRKTGTCPATPLSRAEADADREIARRLGRDHAGCGRPPTRPASSPPPSSRKATTPARADPWMHGFSRPGAPVDRHAIPPQRRRHDRSRRRTSRS